jgi:alpha-mannosidase
MNEKIFKIFHDRVKVLTANHYPEIYPESVELAAEYARTKEPVPFRERLKLEYKPVREGESWGEAWDSAWFHVTGTVPESFAGKQLCLRLHVEGEILIFDDDGVPVCGLTDRSIYDSRYSKVRFPLKNIKAGDRIDLWFEAAANRLMGIDLPSAEEKDPVHPLGSFNPRVTSLRLCVFDRELWLFLLELEALTDLLETFGMQDYRGKQLLHELTRAADVFNHDPANAARARKIFRDGVFTWKAEDNALTAYSIGHAHIDVGWLWPVRESMRKAARTFSSQLALMEEYPDYKFGASQAYLYFQVKEHYPELFEKIRERVREGRWELQGGMFVEADCNLISGESMVRQFLHGKNFFRDEFGVEVRNLWLPDVFGYSAAMPQIIRKAGCDYFLTQKISWSQVNKFPYHTFRWIGVDGSEVLTHFPPEDTYNAIAAAPQRIYGANQFNEAGFLPGFMSLVGIGDGGGGPSENYLERNRIVKDLRGCPKSEWSFASDYFEKIKAYRECLPEWTGELYLERHRGTLTSQSRTKRGNRRCEQALTAWEILASALPASDWPREKLDSAWKTVLLNQFHDIIPGSSIRQVYERTEREHAEVLETAWTGMLEAAGKLFRKKKNSIVLANTLSHEWSGLIELPEPWNGSEVMSGGKALPIQTHNGKTLVLTHIPAHSFQTITRGAKKKMEGIDTGKFILENDLVRYEFDRNGQLIHVFDKELNKEFLAGPGNVLSLYNDRPVNYEAWDVDMYYPREKTGEVRCVSARTVRHGEAFSAAEFVFGTEHSEIVQKIVLGRDSKRLDFITQADWHESRTMLRVSFPVTVRSEKASYDIQYAYVERAAHENTSWDQAKFEMCGQRYADLSDRNCGTALLNDCKYGYCIKHSTLDLALLRSPKYPDRFADQGMHEFTYSFLPHAGTLSESEVMKEAANLNRTPLLADGFESGSAAMPFRLDSDGIALEVVKRAEKDDSLILRLVELRGQHSAGTLHFASKPAKVCETDLMEWNDGKRLKVTGNMLKLELKPFEILTLRVVFPE